MGWKRNPRTGVLRPKNNALFRNEFGGKSRGERRRLLLEGSESGESGPPRQDFTLTTGVSGSNNAGFSLGSYGSMSPGTFEGETIAQLYATTTGTDRIELDFGESAPGNTQITDVDVIELTVEGAPEDAYFLPWDGSRTSYTTTDNATGLENYLDPLDGSDLAVTLREAPTPTVYEYTFLIDEGSSNQYGLDNSPANGLITPATFEGFTMEQFLNTLSGNGLFVAFVETGVPNGYTQLIVDFPDGEFTNAPYTLTRSGSIYRLTSNNDWAEWQTLGDANSGAGTEVNMTIQGSWD